MSAEIVLKAAKPKVEAEVKVKPNSKWIIIIRRIYIFKWARTHGIIQGARVLLIVLQSTCSFPSNTSDPYQKRERTHR